MLRREVLKLLYDIQEAADLVRQFTEGRTLTDYRADPMLRSAVERQLGNAGEALSQAIQIDPSLEHRISDAPRIVAFRNRIIHGYANLNDQVVWGVVEGSVQALRQQVAALLAEGQEGSEG